MFNSKELIRDLQNVISYCKFSRQVFFSDRNVTDVCRYKCFTFLSSCPEPLNLFHQNLAQSIRIFNCVYHDNIGTNSIYKTDSCTCTSISKFV